MSRIGRTPIKVPKDVKILIDGEDQVLVKGKLGELKYSLLPGITIEQRDEMIHVNRSDDSRPQKARHGLTRALLQNMIVGVTEGYTRELHIIGAGYKSAVVGSFLRLNLGHSHEILMEIPEGLTVKSEEMPRAKGSRLAVQFKIWVSGINKEMVGNFAAEIRKCRPPAPNFKGKGIRWSDEQVRVVAKASAK